MFYLNKNVKWYYKNNILFYWLGRPINLCRFSRKIKKSIFKDKYIFNPSHNVHCFLEPSAIVYVTFLYQFCKILLAWMQRSRPGDFGYRSNWWNSFHEVSVPSTETDNNLKVPYQEFLQRVYWDMRFGIILMENNSMTISSTRAFSFIVAFKMSSCGRFFS